MKNGVRTLRCMSKSSLPFSSWSVANFQQMAIIPRVYTSVYQEKYLAWGKRKATNSQLSGDLKHSNLI